MPLDIDGAVAALVAGGRRRIDVGEVNGRTFLINSVLGLPARVTRHREAHRRHLGLRSLLRWVVGVLRHLGRYPRSP